MSDREPDAHPQHPEVESTVTESFSSNGTDPGAYAIASDIEGDEHAEGGATFLTDLAKAMQATATAEQARDAEITEQRRKAHLDSIRAREAIEAEDLRELAKEDVKGIDAWSDGEIKRIKLERERRIASRREQLQIRLEEHRGVVAREVDAVEAAVATYRTEIAGFFSRLGSTTDPVEIARQAGTRPAFPALEDIGPDGARSAAVATAVDEDSAPAPVASDDAAAYNVTMYVSEHDARQDGADEPIAAEAAPVEATAEPEPNQAPETEGEQPAEQEPVTAEAEREPVAAEVEQEPVTAEAEAEPVVAEADQAPVTAEAEQEPVTAESDQLIGAETSDTPMVGVMDPDASSQPAETPWQAPEGYAQDTEEHAPAQASYQDDAPVEAVADEGAAIGQDASSGEQQVEEGSEELAALAGEARVVMPRSTGAGSWLRWPNGSSDRSDLGQ